MAAKKRLIMISQRFPYGAGEVYLERELKYFSESFDSILLYPLQKAEGVRTVPANVKVHDLLSNRTHKVNKIVALKKWKSANRIIKEELEYAGQGSEYLSDHKKDFLAQLFMNYELADLFYDSFSKNAETFETSFYSVWLDEGAVMMAMLKRTGKISSFVIRLHGYDLYDDRREGRYMPFRYFCFKEASRVFVVSEKGAEYTRSLGVFPEKIQSNYSGLDDNGVNHSKKDDVFTIVSCSNLIPLKRVHLLAQIIGKLTDEVKWIHFGDGEEREFIESIINKFPDNITAQLSGRTEFNELMSFYSSKPIHLFIHLSESEGLPMAVVEAMSFGIPVIATDVGGVSEIVTEKEGFLINLDVEVDDVCEKIKMLMDDEKRRLGLAQGARKKYLIRFSAEKNYAQFVNDVKSY
ncbi:MAG: glycosyltransferase involved in cell wall biosynthesis [Parvicellaceae bacterium]|jgi:glycosyltransferase involved in cell wall biosynthesis